MKEIKIPTTTPARIHESTTCDAGPDNGPCELCAWANKSEQRQRIEDQRRTFYVSAPAIRMAIADVLDKGYQCGLANGLSRGELTECNLWHPWQFRFEAPETESETENRTRFIDTVILRLEQLRANGLVPKLENYCPKHIRLRLPRPTSATCGGV